MDGFPRIFQQLVNISDCSNYVCGHEYSNKHTHTQVHGPPGNSLLGFKCASICSKCPSGNEQVSHEDYSLC